MNDRRRDDAIGRRLDDLPTPGHGETFWEDLRAGIRRTPAAAHRDRDRGEAPVVPVGGSSPQRPDRAERRVRQGRRVLALAAALVVLAVAAAVVAVVVLEDDGADDAVVAGRDPASEPTAVPSPTPPPDGTPSPEPTSQPTTEPDPDPSTVDWTAVTDRRVLGPGRLVAASPDGSRLYVADRDPDGGRGCEGAERWTLFVVDVATGERRLADAGITDATGGIDVVFDGGGRAAVLEQCEGFASRLVVVDVGTGGAFAAPSELPVESLGEFVTDLAWSSDGDLLVAATTFGPVDDEPGDRRLLLRVDPATGDVTEVVAEDVVVFAELADGAIVTGTTSSVRIPDARVLDRATPHAITVSPDGTLVALQGPETADLVDVATGEVVSSTASDGDAGATGVWTPDGRAYLATFLQLDTVTSRRIVSVDPGGLAEPTPLVDGADFGEVEVIGGDSLAYSSWVDDLGNSEVVVVTFPPAADG